MKAEDTVLSNGKLLGLFGTPDFTERQGREAQAEITFKAGIREVVEWIEEHKMHLNHNHRQWKAKLKEWGIEK